VSKSCALLCLLAVSAAADAKNFDCSWLTPIPVTGVESEDIEGRYVYAVSSDEVRKVIGTELHRSESILITLEEALRLTHGLYREDSGRKPFLLRSVYWRTQYSTAKISRIGSELTTTMSPGTPKGTCHKSAVVVSLDVAPTSVHFALWGGP
jgi:hypothetical protein